jgi:hypothetical protein
MIHTKALARCMTLAGITPPATLSVVPGWSKKTNSISWVSLDWNSPNFVHVKASVAHSSSETLRIATLSSQSMAIIPLVPPAANPSFRVQFFGPTVQYSLANSSQQPSFDKYSGALANGTLMTVTKSLFESGKLQWSGLPDKTEPLMNIYSAFSRNAGTLGWLQARTPTDGIDEYNNWAVETPQETESQCIKFK